MTTASLAGALKRTPFYEKHVALGAKIVPFAGYEMPVQYPQGLIAEHKAVRERCGLFDVSHMGEFIITGDRAVDFVTYVTTNDVAALALGQVHYSTILNERGTIEDDCLVYRFPDKIMMVVNASNVDKDFAHIARHADTFGVKLENVSESMGLLALQGPKAAGILQPLTRTDLSTIKYYHFAEGEVAGMPMIISRTGYTGEDGFELYHDVQYSDRLWDALMGAGDVTPAGLGARDTLRLEMGMALYGNDIDDTVTPLEANLAWLVKLKKGDFVGKPVLDDQKANGVAKKLVGFTLGDRNIARHGYPVFTASGQPSGNVCSGTMSPTLGIPIGTAYLPTSEAKEGNTFEIEIRGKRVPATVVKPPFYKDASHL
ncbi:MAG TPA: glycine cleavage system aminomethyltransferase GcvT [Gemmatimonadaceae bacterium]|nr:glycine cleavage system aminomethyltransferase GcvT [Gemmatimonadaceae bacterium]